MADDRTIRNVRRYYLTKRHLACDGLASVWRAKQEATAGTALPPEFPCLTALDAAGYTTSEDLAGATVEELITFASLTLREANDVLAAASAL